MYLAIALLGIGFVILAMFQWNSEEVPVDFIPAPTPPEGTEQASRLPGNG